MDHTDEAYARWASMARSLLPKMIEYGLATEREAVHLIEHSLRDEVTGPRAFVPLSWLMIGQWARKPLSQEYAK
jgi:hypothetical protein